MARPNDPRQLPDDPPPRKPPPRPPPKGETAPGGAAGGKATDAYVISSESGTAVAIVYGTSRVSPQLLERDADQLAKIITIPLWQSAHFYNVGDKAVANGNVYEATQQGTSYGGVDVNGYNNFKPPGTGISGTDDDIPDGTMRWKYSAPLDVKAISAGNSFAWMPSTPYVVDQVVQSNGNAYACITAGTSSSTGSVGYGPTGTNSDITDGGAHWMYVKGGYRNFLALGLCEGPIGGLSRSWAQNYAGYWNGIPHDGNQIALYTGGPTGIGTRPAWASYGTNDVYANTAVLLVQYVSEADSALGGVSFEVIGLFADLTTGKANPADVLTDMLTHARRGAAWPSTRIDSTSTDTSAGSWRTYCKAAGLELGWTIDSQTPALALVDQLLETTNSDCVWTNRPDGLGGMLRIVPRADQAITANGVTFTPDTTPKYDLSEADWLAPLKITRASPVNTFNSFPVEFSDKASGYRRITVDDPEMVDVGNRGLKRAGTLSIPHVIDPAAAIMLSRIRAQRSLNVRNAYTFKLGWRFFRLEGTDLVTISDKAWGLDHLPVRIVAIDEDQAEQGSFVVTAEDFPLAVHSAAQYAPQVGDGFTPQSGSPLNRLVVTPAKVPPTTIPDSSNTRGASYQNLWPNPTSETSPPDGADKTTAEWAGRLSGTAFAGSWLRQLSILQPIPRALTNAVGSPSGGSLPAGTYYYAMAFVTASGESFPGSRSGLSVTVSGISSSITISWPGTPPAGVTGIKLWKGTAPDVYTSFTSLAASATSVVDTGATPTWTAGTPPKYTDVCQIIGGPDSVNTLHAPGKGTYEAELSSWVVGATPGSMYRLEAMCRTTTGTGEVALELQFLDAAGNILARGAQGAGSNATYAAWTRVWTRGVAVAGTVAVRAVLRVWSFPGQPATTAQFDEILLIPEYSDAPSIDGIVVGSSTLVTAGSNTWTDAGISLLGNSLLNAYSDTRPITLTLNVSGYAGGGAGGIQWRLKLTGVGSGPSFGPYYVTAKPTFFNTIAQHQGWTLTWTIPAGTLPIGTTARVDTEVISPTGSAASFSQDFNDAYSLRAAMV